MKILVYQPRLLGDIILGSTAAEQLKKKYPECEITYITGYKELVKTNPFIDKVLEKKIKHKNEQNFFSKIRKKYNLSYFLLNWLPKKNCLQDFMAQCDLPRKNYQVKLYLTKKDIILAKKYISKLKLSPNRKTIALQKDFERKWNSQEFERLKKILTEKYNLVFIGYGMRFGLKILNLREAAAVASLCDVFIGGVSGILHAVVATNTPTIATPNVYNARWVMPEFYQNEFIKQKKKKHITVYPKPSNFCGDYKCVSLSNGRIEVHAQSHTPEKCPVNDRDGCIHSIKAEDIIKKINLFFSIK